MKSTAAAGSGQTAAGKPSCIDEVTDFDASGPFTFTLKAAGDVKLWVPGVATGCKVPVVHLAITTMADCGQYQPLLEHLASHGFLAVCSEDDQSGAGTLVVAALEAARSMYPALADNKFGSLGHGPGGQGGIVGLQLAEAKWGMGEYRYTALGMEPASGFGLQPAGGTWQSVYAKLRSPVLLFSGTADMLVSQAWVQQAYDALAGDVEAYHWSAVGATHTPVPNAYAMRVAVPWLRWKLLGDKRACAAFKSIPDRDDWNEIASKNVRPCD